MPANTKERIYIVVSDAQTSLLLERILRSAGYEVATAGNRYAAQQMFEKAAPSIVVISDQLPDGSGLELVGQWMERLPLLPAILFSTKESPDLWKAAVRAGIREYFCPPLRSDQILNSVHRLLKQNRQKLEWVSQEIRRHHETLQKRVDELESLAMLGRSITASLDLEEVLTAIVDAAVALTGAEEGSLLLLDEESGELYMRAARNFQEDFVRTFRLPTKDSLAGSVLRTGQPVVLDESTPQKIKTAYLVQSLLYVPLLSREKVIGVLGVDNRQNRLPFTDNQVKAISAMADFAVVALENARLFNQTNIERNKLEAVLTKIQDGVIVIDGDGRILMANPVARETLRLEDNPVDKLIQNVIHQADLLQLLASPDARTMNRAEISLEDGRVFAVQLTPIPEIGTAITMHDITYLKKLDKIKSDFVKTVSNDLRSPLTAILGYINLLEQAGPVNAEQRDFIKHIQGSVRSITSMTDELVNLGRIEAGFDTRKEIVPLGNILQYSLDSVKLRAGEKGLQLLTEIPGDLPPLYANPLQLRQMVDHLIDNAVKFTGEGGSVSIGVTVQHNQILLKIADSGIGIPPMDLPFIFDKFYRASNAPLGVGGAGLGLSIVRSIVEIHQGRIWVDSKPGQGTTVTVVLPAVEQPA